MYSIYTFTWLIFRVNEGKYTSPMDAMDFDFCFYLTQSNHPQRLNLFVGWIEVVLHSLSCTDIIWKGCQDPCREGDILQGLRGCIPYMLHVWCINIRVYIYIYIYIHLHLAWIYGKCRHIYHTWSIWVCACFCHLLLTCSREIYSPELVQIGHPGRSKWWILYWTSSRGHEHSLDLCEFGSKYWQKIRFFAPKKSR